MAIKRRGIIVQNAKKHRKSGAKIAKTMGKTRFQKAIP